VSPPTQLQEAILDAKRSHPTWSNARIADHVGCSASYVSETLVEYDTTVLDTLDHEPATPADVDPPSASTSPSGGDLFWWLFVGFVLWVLLWKLGAVPPPGEILWLQPS
jgi:hypothetical protein